MTLGQAIAQLKPQARDNPREFVAWVLEESRRMPSFVATVMLMLGHELPTCAVNKLLVALGRLDIPVRPDGGVPPS